MSMDGDVSVEATPAGGGIVADPDLASYYCLHTFERCGSTNDEARRMGRAGLPHGAIVWAREQTAGRGRSGRGWQGGAGNLYASLLLRPARPATEVAQLAFVAAVAAVEAVQPVLQEVGAGRVRCKWPNDLVLNGKKLGGILLESEVPGQGGRTTPLPWVVLGIGMNVEHAPEGPGLSAISLRDAGVELISAKIILSRFIECFCVQYRLWMTQGFAPIRAAWEAAALGLGAAMTVQEGTPEHPRLRQGTCLGLDDDGALLIREPNAAEVGRITSGEVFLGTEPVHTLVLADGALPPSDSRA